MYRLWTLPRLTVATLIAGTLLALASSYVIGQPSTSTVSAQTPLFEIPMFPGSNLISLPANPLDLSVNAVFSDLTFQKVVTTAKTHGFDLSSICNPEAIGAGCLVAERDGGGQMTGSLTTITAGQGYWVSTISFQPFKVAIPSESFSDLPHTPVFSGFDIV